MGANRFHFADDEQEKAPPKVWVTRAVIVGVLVGLAGAAHIVFGMRFF